jgi:CBS-domain-containing membrane protein
MASVKVMTVSEIMSSPLVVVRDRDTVRRAIDRFVTTDLHHLVVLDADDRLVGVLDDRAVLAEWPLDVTGARHRTVGELMRGRADRFGANARTSPATSLRVAGRRMLELGLDALPVLDDLGAVVGIVTGSDLLRSLVADGE